MENILSFNEIKEKGIFENGVIILTESFSVDKFEESSFKCMKASSIAMFEGENAPKIKFMLTVAGQDKPLYESHSYTIGSNVDFTLQEWRIPPIFLPEMKLTIKMSIPENCKLKLKSFCLSYENSVLHKENFIKFNAHLGFLGIAPQNSMPSIEMAALMGYEWCIVVPKTTKDGKLVCIHNDTINEKGRDENGNPPESDLYVKDMTYEELLKWDFGVSTNEIYKGVKIPLVEEFFDVCQRTGMKPMFSTHPGLSVKQWENVKQMLKKRQLLADFHIKSFELENLLVAYSVFGNEIDGYTWDNEEWEDCKIQELLSLGIDTSKCRAGIELLQGSFDEKVIQKIINAGFFAGAFGLGINDSETYKKLISYGVTEFSEDQHCSMGLNW